MKKIMLLCIVLVVCIGVVFAQNNGQGMEQGNQECVCDCDKDWSAQGQPMQQGYVPMGQDMKKDDEQGDMTQVQEKNKEEKKGNNEYNGQATETNSCDEKFAFMEAYISELKKFISENGLTPPEPQATEETNEEKKKEEQTEQQDKQKEESGEKEKQGEQQDKQKEESGEKEKQGEQQPGEMQQEPVQQFKGFFKKMFQFFQKSPDMTQPPKEEPTQQPE